VVNTVGNATIAAFRTSLRAFIATAAGVDIARVRSVAGLQPAAAAGVLIRLAAAADSVDILECCTRCSCLLVGP
jgi:hypothetical protein